jgi:hypothetical protein
VQLSFIPRNFQLGFVLAIIVIAGVELQSWAFVRAAMYFGSLRFYSPDIFTRLTDEQLSRAVIRRPLGWPASEDPRAAPFEPARICGSAFGDSMTLGSEVKDEEAWVYLLSFRLGCTVRNYGQIAYGLDQAVLRFERVETEGQFVILGVLLPEMVRRSLAASWTFYSSLDQVQLVKPYFTLDGEGLRLHPIPDPLTRQSVAAHHANDYYMQKVYTPATFPYTVAALREIYLWMTGFDDYRYGREKYLDSAHPSGSGVLARRLIARFAQTARHRNARLVIVLIPGTRSPLIDTPLEQQFASDLRRSGEACVIDLKPALRRHVDELGGTIPHEPAGHYTPLGNRWIADIVGSGLAACGIAAN